jgi:hypothetical protein
VERPAFSPVAIGMFWIFLTILVVLAFFVAASRRRRYESVEEEPWRASLEDDEPLDWDAARKAEDEWLSEESWNSDGDDGEAWRNR